MDELAYALGMDPIELRIRNEPHGRSRARRAVQRSPSGRVHARRRAPVRLGAAARSTRERCATAGGWSATAWRPQSACTSRLPTKVRGAAWVRMGSPSSRSDMTDIGTGHLHDPDPGRGRRARPADRSGAGRAGTLGLSRQRGLRRLVGRRQLVHRALPRLRGAAREAARVGDALPPKGWRPRARSSACTKIRTTSDYSIHTYGAQFAEVGVDIDTAEIRLRRMLGVFAAGRILNAKTARSQLIGGMIFGVSAALHEEAVVDTRTGAFVNRDLAEYLVPVHADIPRSTPSCSTASTTRPTRSASRASASWASAGPGRRRERGVQRHRRTGARLPDHARQGAALPATGGCLNRRERSVGKIKNAGASPPPIEW